MTRAATAAAVVPPNPPWGTASTTAIATGGLSAGANPMNDATLPCPPPASPAGAVPVFPAMSSPRTFAAVPVPCVTTPRSISARRRAVRADAGSHPGLRTARDCHHQSMARVRFSAPLAMVAMVATALLAVGCGSGGHAAASHSSTTRSRTTARRHAPPAVAVGPRRPQPADARTIAVIRHWADALRRGDVRGAARYFEIPSVFAPAPDQEVTIHSLAEAEAANRALPCGAKLISVVKVSGQLVQALFRLTGRPGPGGSACNPGAGETARTNFVIVSGHIHVWFRAPDEPGDNQQPPPGPNASGGGGPVV